MDKLLIVGKGGHGQVVAEIAEDIGLWSGVAFLDDRCSDESVVGKTADMHRLIGEYRQAVVAIGDNERRLELLEELANCGYQVPTLIHPRAWLSRYSQVGSGTVVLPGAVVNRGVKLGKGCIVNINSSIDHDCDIGDGVHVGTGATIRSLVRISKASLIGARACVRQGSFLGERCILSDGEVI